MSRETAFLYDFLQVPGGAEQVALHLYKQFEEMHFAFGFIDRSSFPGIETDEPRVQSLTSPSKIPGWLGLKSMWAFQRKAGFLRDYQTVIYSGVYAPVSIQHHPDGRNLYYCHTPPRFVYDLRSSYLQQANAWQRIMLRFLIEYLQPRYENAIHQMDAVVANSFNVRSRLQKYLDLSDVEVIYPPVNTGGLTWLGQGDYYLSTARLEPYKRVEPIVRAFMKMPSRKLVVASGGSDFHRLKKLADGHQNIAFTGWCAPGELKQLMGNCIATIYVPHDEDFGMSPVESMAAGKPVIGVAEGGLLESVVDGETGLLINTSVFDSSGFSNGQDLVNSIIEGVHSMSEAVALKMRSACEDRAAQFDTQVFDQKIEALINK